MSDWIDLQLAHSLTRVQAPDELWARINAPVARPRRPIAIRWAAPTAIAACVMVMLSRPVREDRVFASNAPAVVMKQSAHKARVTVSASEVQVTPESNSGACRLCHTL